MAKKREIGGVSLAKQHEMQVYSIIMEIFTFAIY
jgi:hypothetical protein